MSIMKTGKRMSLAEKIRVARRQAGLTQRQLSKILKVSDKAISSYEVGRAQPSVEMIKTISRVTYKPVGYFMTDDASGEIEISAKLEMVAKELHEVLELLKKEKKLDPSAE